MHGSFRLKTELSLFRLLITLLAIPEQPLINGD